MSNFVVSARKYRPTTFDSVVGQKSITDTLKNAIKTGHLAQAFLFCGSRGVGKTTCARILAKTINCSNRTENIEACNECESCKSFNEGNSLNILEMDAASNNSVDNIRELTDQVRFAPQIGDYKVYIIDEVHMLSPSAFNAFLKTLEEPPPHAIFILATTEKHKIIPTILSRCQIFDFNRINVDDISAHLQKIAEKEGINAEEEALHLIAEKADGALRDALSIFDQLVSFSGDQLSYQDVIQNLNILDYDYYFKATDIILNNNIPAALLLFDEIRKRGFDGQLFINGLAAHLRNLLVCQNQETLKLLEVAPSLRDRYNQQAQSVDTAFLMKALEICKECDYQYKGSKDQRLLVELSLMQMASIRSAPRAEKKKHEIRSLEELNLQEASNKQAQKSEAVTESQETKEELSQQTKDSSTTSTQAEAEKEESQANEFETTSQKEDIANPAIEQESPPETTIEKVDESEPSVQGAKQTAKEELSEEKTEEQLKKVVASRNTNKSEQQLDSSKTRRLSISALTNDPEEEKAAAEKSAFSSEERKEYDQATFMQVWNELAEKIKTEAKEGASMIYPGMTSRPPVLKDDFKIELTVDNKSQKEEIMLARTDIHDHLRKRLSNGAIELLLKVNKDPKQRKAYTDEEKFKEMAEKNPDVLKLKQQLDLDFL